MAVNLRLAEPAAVAAIPIDHFDGLNTFQDRTARCQEQAADAGLRGKRGAAYTRRCVNAQ